MQHDTFYFILYIHCGIVLPDLLPYNIVPGPVSEVSYEENTDTSVIITWRPPNEPNGVITYFVEHEVYQNESTKSLGIDVRQSMSAVIQALSELLPLRNLMNTV